MQVIVSSKEKLFVEFYKLLFCMNKLNYSNISIFNSKVFKEFVKEFNYKKETLSFLPDNRSI